MTAPLPPLTARQGLAYGLLGLPLAFAALPLYVLLPNHYAREYGMPLATVGAVLLAARLLDAATDPLLGRWSDHLFSARPAQCWLPGRCRQWCCGWGWPGCFSPLCKACPR